MNHKTNSQNLSNKSTDFKKGKRIGNTNNGLSKQYSIIHQLLDYQTLVQRIQTKANKAMRGSTLRK